MEKLLTRPEMAALLQVSAKTVQRLTTAGTIPHLKVGNESRYDRQAVVAALTVAPEPDPDAVRWMLVFAPGAVSPISEVSFSSRDLADKYADICAKPTPLFPEGQPRPRVVPLYQHADRVREAAQELVHNCAPVAPQRLSWAALVAALEASPCSTR